MIYSEAGIFRRYSKGTSNFNESKLLVIEFLDSTEFLNLTGSFVSVHRKRILWQCVLLLISLITHWMILKHNRQGLTLFLSLCSWECFVPKCSVSHIATHTVVITIADRSKLMMNSFLNAQFWKSSFHQRNAL